MLLRPCLESDLPSVHAIEEACFGQAGALPFLVLRQYLDLCGTGFIVCDAGAAMSGNALAGFAVGGIALDDHTIGWILDVSVAPAFQGRGLGAGLCRRVLSLFSEKEARSARATVMPENHRSLSMLSRLGFTVIADIPDYFGPNERRLLVEIRLK